MISNQCSKSILTPFDKKINFILFRILNNHKYKSLFIALALYVIILLIFGDFLKISCNYFVLIPLIAFSFVYGFPGGLLFGMMALPLNIMMFYMMGQMSFVPDNLYIAELSGLLVGGIIGYQSEYFMKLIKEIEVRRTAESLLRESLEDKELLLKEVNHRVRNNLNIIKSLIQLHSNKMDHPVFREECDKLKDRVFSISLIHEQLFLENQPLMLDLPRYMDTLLDNLVLSIKKQDVCLNRQWPNTGMPISSYRVLYLGLIVHEVVMNSLKYGCPADGTTEIFISLDDLGRNQYLLRISDNGSGFDPQTSAKGLGLRMIETLSQHLDGSVHWEFDEGCCFFLEFSNKQPEVFCSNL
jgi:two-component sensor histidine kinase